MASFLSLFTALLYVFHVVLAQTELQEAGFNATYVMLAGYPGLGSYFLDVTENALTGIVPVSQFNPIASPDHPSDVVQLQSVSDTTWAIYMGEIALDVLPTNNPSCPNCIFANTTINEFLVPTQLWNFIEFDNNEAMISNSVYGGWLDVKAIESSNDASDITFMPFLNPDKSTEDKPLPGQTWTFLPQASTLATKAIDPVADSTTVTVAVTITTCPNRKRAPEPTPAPRNEIMRRQIVTVDITGAGPTFTTTSTSTVVKCSTTSTTKSSSSLATTTSKTTHSSSSGSVTAASASATNAASRLVSRYRRDDILGIGWFAAVVLVIEALI